MMLLVSALWPGLAGALVLGLLVGTLSGFPSGRVAVGAAALIGVALAVLAGLTVTGSIAERAGFAVETAALTLAAYLAGCTIGGGVRALRSGRR